MNASTLKDVYKVDHRRQYPEGTSFVFSNFTPRTSRIPEIDHITFFGLQYLIKRYLIQEWNQSFFAIPKQEALRRYRRRVDSVLGPNDITLDHLADLHDLGYLPIAIRALPEGSQVPIGVPPMVIYNTHANMFWLPNYLETLLSCVLWQPCTSATIAREYRNIFEQFAAETSDDQFFVNFQGHDFSFRGMSSVETAMVSGAGHLLSFMGTDTIPAIDFLEDYYYANADSEMIGVSVPATEHSVMCMGTQEGEIETFRRLFGIYPNGILSVVSDTWDYWSVLTNILPRLKDEILARDGKLVIRPDSSPKTPYEIIVGDSDALPGSPEFKGSIEILWELFGGKINSKGYKELDSHIGLIYGDSITRDLARKICQGLKDKGFASTNWVAGIGSYTYQYNTRDTFGWAMKATYGVVNGKPREIFKAPKTDSGVKKSAKGILAVNKVDGGYVLQQQATMRDVQNSALELVFEDGHLIRKQTLLDIRRRILA